MLEIPGFRYDPTIKNYIPILSNTPENRALNLVTASSIIKHDRKNNLKNQIRLTKKVIARSRSQLYPSINGSVLNIYNLNKYQQIGIHGVTNTKLLNTKRLDFGKSIIAEIDRVDESYSYHQIRKALSPDYDNQFIVSHFSPSPYKVYYTLHQLHYSNAKPKLKMRSQIVQKMDDFGGMKFSVNGKQVILMSNKEFFVIDKDSLNKSNIKFNRELQGTRLPFDTSDKLFIGINSKKGMTHLASYDLSYNQIQPISYKCDWERKWIFSDLMFDNFGDHLFMSLRGRMSNCSECILQHDLRCPIPSQKNIRRSSLNFHQNSWVSMTRVPNYSDLIVTHCFDGRCALWDMRWKDRPAVTYKDISSGRSDIPIDIDPTAQFVTLTDGDGIVRIFNLKTGYVLFSEKHDNLNDSSNQIFSFYSQTGLFNRPSLVSHLSPNEIKIRYLTL